MLAKARIIFLMSFWTRTLDRLAGIESIEPNANGPLTHNPGDPDGLELVGFDEPAEERAAPAIALPTPWDGYPSGWQPPNWQQATGRLNSLVDIAWACLDLNSNVISSMPVYRTRDSRIIEPAQWMLNPDPAIYSSWQEFAKQLFWDFQLGEAFVLPFGNTYSGAPARFRVMPPWSVEVEMKDGLRSYKVGNMDVTDEILHIRYKSTVTEARGQGPLEVAGARTVAIGLLQRYANHIAETGGVPLYWMSLDRKINESEGRDILDRWIESRTKYAGHPALVANGAKLNQSNAMNARDMSLLELSQFNESRIAVLMGVPPFLVGLAGASGSMTYSNVADLFDFHDRSSLRPKVRMVMEALGGWALPRGQSAELNRDDYTRLPFDKRMQAYKTAIEMRILTPEEVRIMERFYGEPAAQALTGGTD